VTKRNCNIYRLQDVYYYLFDPDDHAVSRRRQIPEARKALRDACVVIPRSVRTKADLWKLAKQAGDAKGFDAHAGVYRNKK
jgi:hypothetical protein